MSDEDSFKSRALAVRCPLCASDPGVSCRRGRKFLEEPHAVRVYAAEGREWQRVPNPGRRQFQQRRADPTITIRRMDDEDPQNASDVVSPALDSQGQ
jgi:hypothetical protein